jgi:hypothetical protein
VLPEREQQALDKALSRLLARSRELHGTDEEDGN